MKLFDPTLALDSLPTILSGLPLSLFLLAVCFFLANIGGIFIMFLRISHNRLFSLFARFYISFFRGVPVLVVLFLTYFGANMDAIPAAILSLTLVSSAFVAEYYRSALIGINETQSDAARALGLSNFAAMRYVILPQAFRIALPALGNVLLDMFKGTSLAAMITVSEMFMKAKITAGASQDYMTIYIVIAIIYWLVCCGLSFLEQLTERRFHY
ncbi:amino acid ABC superfamily ATP binding cassette transporter, membrane protein [Liquorilactobacillus aquaticus DSM 21051]|uniref:Amino acid ABC superfamily ATP binding cassette transporter, membrane protein n=1 Tax=Liquorilactobacillus aquaticus DSM 21051 TaxID=1423725 RepID=A0A0R2D8F0_9LACO|nr:amino acid ABC transporter permease [Liquorilactobacillus aquaticus]KRM96827.1 amino acid ABC superfamily ATP binding cassette transporter, membrane protein [Liquorilactobacillus aquaticus DSM 21051]